MASPSCIPGIKDLTPCKKVYKKFSPNIIVYFFHLIDMSLELPFYRRAATPRAKAPKEPTPSLPAEPSEVVEVPGRPMVV
jgi:hypothetical protein